jgi:hypothetical protein
MPLICIRLRRPRRLRAASRPLARRGVFVTSLAGAMIVAACGGRDPFAPDPRNNADTQQAEFLLYPLSVATGPLGSAVSLQTLSVVRPGVTIFGTVGASVSAPNFDFAVDRAPGGPVQLLPSRLVVDLTGVGQVYRTGFQVTATPFDSVVEAPASGYLADSAISVLPGQAVIVQAQSAACTALYAKVVVLAVDAATGGVTFRTRVNPNCGFRSLRPGRG